MVSIAAKEGLWRSFHLPEGEEVLDFLLSSLGTDILYMYCAGRHDEVRIAISADGEEVIGLAESVKGFAEMDGSKL
jgi:hypothetical protein